MASTGRAGLPRAAGRFLLYDDRPMFRRFENFLNPTESPARPEPPAGLIAFLWHFARQAKWLFVALFVVELLVALTDSAVPWFMGRIVTLVTKIAARPLPRRDLAVARRHGAGRA